MEKLDEALLKLRENMKDPKAQSGFYDIFLNATFLVPVLEADGADQTGGPLPLVLEVEGVDYLMLFSSLERFQAWAQQEAPCVEVPGHVLAASSTGNLHWALNVGSEYSKQFHPDEIAWLKESVELCNAEAAKAGGA